MLIGKVVELKNKDKFLYGMLIHQQMLKGPVLNLSVLHLSVFQNWPDRGLTLNMLKKGRKRSNKKVEKDIGLINS